MRKIRHRLLLGLLISTLALISGCENNKQVLTEEIPMGRYIEQSVKADNFDLLEGDVIGLLKTKENKLQLYEMNNGLQIYEQGDGDSWIKVEKGWIKEFNKLKLFQAPCIANDEEGNVYIVYQEYDDNKKMTYTHIAKGEGDELKKLNIPWQQTKGSREPTSISILKNGDMVIVDERVGIERYSLSNESFVRSYEGKTSEAIVVNDTLYQINSGQGTIEAYDVDNGKLKRSIPCDTIDANAKLVVGEDEDLYLVGNSGIKHLTKGGSVWELIVDGNNAFFKMPSYTCTYAKAINKEIYTLFKRVDGGAQFKKYFYSKDTPTTASRELIAYTLKENNSLNQIITQYQGSNPEVKITVQIGLERGSSLTEEDAIKALNTEILAGKGPDLILLDGLDIETYIEKGMLTDMSNWLKTTEEPKMYLENIVQAYETQEKIYAVPMRFTLPMLWGNKAIIDQVENLEDLATYQREHPDEKVLPDKAADELINRFYIACRPDWFDSQGKLQEESMISFLESVKALANQGKYLEYMKMQTSRKFKLLGLDMETMLDFAYSFIEIQFGEPAGIKDLLAGAAANKQRGDGSLAPLQRQSKEVFEPRTILSINAASKNQEIAKDIIEMALSEDIQDTDIEDGFPINKVSFEKWLKGKTFNKNTSFGVFDVNEGKQYKLQIGWKDEYDLAQYYEYCKSAKIPVVIDEKLLKIILEESAGYFDGDLTVQEAVTNIKQKTEFYLAE